MESVFHKVIFWVLAIELVISLIMGLALIIDFKYNTDYFGKITGFVQKIVSKKKKILTTLSFRERQRQATLDFFENHIYEQSEESGLFNKLNVKFTISHE